MKFTTQHDVRSLTVELPGRAMWVTVHDDGSIIVHQDRRDVGPDLYDMGGDYELTLPDVTTVAEECSARDADTGNWEFPASGTATVEVTHRH